MNGGKIMRSQLARARGLGSAKSGIEHWWTERVSAAALVPLSLWFVFSVLSMLGADQPVVTAGAVLETEPPVSVPVA